MALYKLRKHPQNRHLMKPMSYATFHIMQMDEKQNRKTKPLPFVLGYKLEFFPSNTIPKI